MAIFYLWKQLELRRILGCESVLVHKAWGTCEAGVAKWSGFVGPWSVSWIDFGPSTGSYYVDFLVLHFNVMRKIWNATIAK